MYPLEASAPHLSETVRFLELVFSEIDGIITDTAARAAVLLSLGLFFSGVHQCR